MFTFGNMNIITVFWIAVVLIVFVVSFFRYRERASHHRMIETLAEKGQPIPPQLLSGEGLDRSNMRYGNAVGSGIVLVFVGIALAIFFGALGGGGTFIGTDVPNWLPVIGIFPFMVGLARIIGYFIERPRSK